MEQKAMSKLIICWLVFLTVVLCLAWTNTLKTSTPAGTDDPREADDRMREIKAAFVERFDIDHACTASAASTFDDANTGKHDQVTFLDLIGVPAQVAKNAHLWMVSDELWWQDDTNAAIQLTESGYIEYQSITDVNSDTYIVSRNAADDGTVDLIKADVNDLACLPDGAILEAATASGDPNRTISDKAYVDDQVDTQNMTPAAESDAAGSTGQTVYPNTFRIARGEEEVVAGATDTITVAGFSQVYAAVVTWKSGTATDFWAPKVNTLSTNTFRITNTNNTDIPCFWIAVGR